MHDIIKKALDEALTEKYYAELMGCEDTDYAFSVGFSSEMKTLIRKTDNKLIYYSKYIAAAACAVVAIGCAVLLPGLMNSEIDVVEPEVITSATTDGDISDVTEKAPEQTTAIPEQTTAVEDAAPVDTSETTLDTDSAAPSDNDSSVSEDTTEQIVTSPVEEDENPGAGGDVADDVVVDDSAETQTGVKDDEDSPVGGNTDTDSDVDTDVEEDTEEVEEEAEAEADIADDTEDDTDDDIVSEDDAEAEEEESVELEDEATDEEADEDVEEDSSDGDWRDDTDIWGDDAIIDGDDTIIDGDDAVIEDDDDVVEDDDVEEDSDDDVVIEDEEDDDDNPATGDGDQNPSGGGAADFDDLPIIPGNTMREVLENAVYGAVFDKLYISYIGIDNIDVANGGKNMYRFDTNILSYDYIREYILSCGDMAPVYPDSYMELYKGEVMYVTLSTADERYEVSMFDNSFRNRYEEYFGGVPEEDVDEEDVEPLDGGEWVRFEICEDGGIIMNGYDGRAAYFKVDSAKAAELFAKIRRMNITETAATVGDIMASAEINADNISEGTAKIKNLYDISIWNVPVDSAEAKKAVADFFEKYRNSPVRKLSDVPYSNSTMKNGLEIRFGLNSTSAIMRLVIDSENRAVISDGRIAYAFDITLDDVKLLMNCICQWAGIAEPVFYETLADYIVGKYYNRLTYVYYNENNAGVVTAYNISTASKLSAVYNMVLTEAGKLKYAPFESNTTSALQLTTENYGISFTKDGYLRMGQSSFKGAEKLYNDIISFVKANADIAGSPDDKEDEEITEDEEVTDDVEVEDEVEIEEDIYE